MKLSPKTPPREFTVGFGTPTVLKDCGTLSLAPDEQITFTTEDGADYDVARKDWGFYATPSTNARLMQNGLRTVIVRNRVGRLFVLLVRAGKEAAFEHYVDDEKLEILAWLDTQDACDELTAKLR